MLTETSEVLISLIPVEVGIRIVAPKTVVISKDCGL
jgi:hypothetical protein